MAGGEQRAALLLTNATGTDITSVVLEATRRKPLRQVDTLILAANLKALPMLERLNPIPGRQGRPASSWSR